MPCAPATASTKHRRHSAACLSGAALTLLLSACSASAPPDALLQPASGGDTTVAIATRHAYSRPAANLSMQQRSRFFIGNAFFNSPWVAAPASTTARDGLGPLFNARSCDACHNNDGRGRPPLADEQPVSLVIQFATATAGANNEPQADPHYGANFNPFAIGAVPPEGELRITHQEIQGEYGDGTAFTLLAPIYEFTALAYGELAADTGISPRVAPAVFGVGLLEAIDQTQIMQRHDPEDADGDGISGRINLIWEPVQGRQVPGRFGWKLNQPDIAHQTAAAFSTEMGLTTPLRPQEICTAAQRECQAAPTGGEPEISAEIFAHIVDYQRMLAVPQRRNLDAPAVRRGARIFDDIGCEACHRASFITAQVPDQPWLSAQRIHPFTDLLLHDMGEALADGRTDFDAAPSEWRTPPLWGLGLQATVNGHTRLLHDGRARDISEAILWHGGEALPARERFRLLPADQRAALLQFLESL